VKRPASVAETGRFIEVLRAACDNDEIYRTLERLLSLPDGQRRAVIAGLVERMRVQGAPADFIAAMACLHDDAVAEKAFEVIYRCRG
jgi:hypothetical protein